MLGVQREEEAKIARAIQSCQRTPRSKSALSLDSFDRGAIKGVLLIDSMIKTKIFSAESGDVFMHGQSNHHHKASAV
jgi:hypothetical protein